jgi:hypothetical protein
MILTKTGKLRKKFLPAVYLDSSFVIDYWRTEGMEMPENEMDRFVDEDELLQVVRNILASEVQLNRMAEIRKKLLFEETKVTPVVSPLSLLELMEWQAEAAFKQIASEASGVGFIQKRSKKQVGDYLKEALKMRRAESEKQKGGKGAKYTTGLEWLMSETWLNRSFLECHGLRGLLQVDIVNFQMTINKAWMEPSAYAYLQLGTADIIHILLAQHLGCKYIASFDSDFARVKDIIQEETGILVLTSPKEILAIL